MDKICFSVSTLIKVRIYVFMQLKLSENAIRIKTQIKFQICQMSIFGGVPAFITFVTTSGNTVWLHSLK